MKPPRPVHESQVNTIVGAFSGIRPIRQRHTEFFEMGRVIRGRFSCFSAGSEMERKGPASFPIPTASSQLLIVLCRSEKGC